MVQTKEENNNNWIRNFKSKHPTPGQPESLPGRNTPSYKESIKPETISYCSTNCFPGGTVVKNPPANAGDSRDVCSIPGGGEVPWIKKWQLTPVFLPGKSHGQRGLGGYSLEGCKVGHDWAHTHTSRDTKAWTKWYIDRQHREQTSSVPL